MSVERQLMMCAGGATQQYTISNSLRFRASASAYLNRTPSVAGNRQTWTLSCWLKRGAIGVTYAPIFAAGSSGSAYSAVWFHNDVIEIYSYNGSTQYYLGTNQVFRDPSSWYHIVLSIDTTQATSSNRIKLYVNGNQVTSFSSATYPSQNYSDYFDSTSPHYFGQFTPALGSYYFDGYLTEVNFIDGQALTPSSFGATDTTTGVWVPKKYTGSYGTNGFYLNFNNNTSTTALGYDTSGNGNNWTPNNFSLTTGSTYDSMIDSPTSYASGTNNVGNYAVLNPLDSGSSGVLVETDGNLSASQSTGLSVYRCGTSTIIPTSSKYYAEFVIGSIGSGSNVGAGVIEKQHSRDTYAGGASGGVGYLNDGRIYLNTALAATYSTFTTNDVISVAVDYDTGKVWFAVNNTWQNSGNPATGANAVATLTPANLMAICGTTARGSGASGSTGFYANFGQRPFAYTPPSGYNALNTYNLSTPSIVDGSKQFAASLYTGTGSSLSVSGANFTPDFVWIKSRSAATDHKLTDVVRGVTKALVSDSTAAETTDTNGLTAFNSNGFTVGTDTVYNNSGATYVGWQWKANGAGVTNTDGSITSSVSANQTAGFSVVTYTGTGSAATVGHGLGVAPSMIIIKERSPGGDNWQVYHSSVISLANGKQWLALNTTDSVQTNGSATTFTSASATTFGIGDSGALNQSTATYVAYCFAAIPGYSAFGSYTGNGSTDGPFVYCGFRPRWVMIKGSTISTVYTSWQIIDTSRTPYNVNTATLWANASYAEGARGNGSTPAGDVNNIDILSNGFKLRVSAYDENNDTGKTYIYAAFAESPFKFSLAR